MAGRKPGSARMSSSVAAYDWIIAGMLERVGVEILEQHAPLPTHAEFVCRRSR